MDHIINAISAYVKKESTNYAVMITGAWGSGKTYFWNHTLKEIVEQIPVMESPKKYSTIYVSLYGIQTVEDIAKKIFLNKFVRLNNFSKQYSPITELGKVTWSMFKEVNIQGVKLSNPRKINFDEFLNFQNIVICFDDLERSKIEISTIMGYISNFVEHDNAKVIILCNEKEIFNDSNRKNQELKLLTAAYLTNLSKQYPSNNTLIDSNSSKDYKSILSEIQEDYFGKSDIYKKYKEKLIGITLLYNPQNKEQISNLIKSLKDETVKEFLNTKVTEINNLVLKSGLSNLRIIQRAFFDFESVYKHIQSYDHRLMSTELLTEILICLVAVSLEIKTGKEESDFLEIINIHFPIDMAEYQAPAKKDLYQKYIKSFLERYFHEDTKDKFKFFKFIESLVRTGYINNQLFENDIFPYLEQLDFQEPEAISFLKGEWISLNNEDFSSKIGFVYSELEKGVIPYKLYFSAYKLFRSFVEDKLFDKELSLLLTDFKTGVNRAINNSDRAHYLDSFNFLSRNENNSDELDYMNHIIERIKISIQSNTKIEKNAIIQMIESDFETFLEKIDQFDLESALFEYADPQDLLIKTTNLSNANLNKFILAIKKYSSENLFDKEKERPIMQEYVKQLELHIESNIRMLSSFLLRRLIIIIKEIYNLD